MRILVIGAILDPSWKGGEPVVARYTVEGLKALGNEVLTIYKKRNFYENFLHGPSDVNPYLFKFYLSKIKRIKPDVILLFYDYDTTALFASKVLGIPCVVAVHIYWPFCPHLTMYQENRGICQGMNLKRCLSHLSGKNLYEKILSFPCTAIMYVRNKLGLRRLSIADAIIVPSGYVAKLFIDYGFNNVHIVYTGININEIPYTEWQDKTGVKIILNSTGYPAEYKGFHHFLILANYIGKLRKDIKFIATGFYGKKGAVKGLGYLPRREYIKIISNAYFAVAPILWADPCPQAVLLPMAVGRPVVAYSSGGIPEQLGEGGGILIEPGNIKELISSVTYLIDDEDFTRELGKKARYIIERKITIDHTIQGYYRILKKISQ